MPYILPPSDMALLRETIARQHPALLPLLDKVGVRPLTVQQRENLTRAIGYEFIEARQIDSSDDYLPRLDELIDFLWKNGPLPPSDRELLRETIARQHPALLPLLDKVGVRPLTEEERNMLRTAVSDEFVATGLAQGYSPNARGLRLEALIDYLSHM